MPSQLSLRSRFCRIKVSRYTGSHSEYPIRRLDNKITISNLIYSLRRIFERRHIQLMAQSLILQCSKINMIFLIMDTQPPISSSKNAQGVQVILRWLQGHSFHSRARGQQRKLNNAWSSSNHVKILRGRKRRSCSYQSRIGQDTQPVRVPLG